MLQRGLRRGHLRREFNEEVIIVGFCATFVVKPRTGPDFGTCLVIGTDYNFVTGIFIGTDVIFGTEFDLGSDYVLGIANRLVITHAGADFIIGTGSFIHFAYGFFDPRVVVFVGGHCGGK